MRLSDLIEHLTTIAEQLEDLDPEVRLATQLNWPLAHSVYRVRHLADPEVDLSPENPGIVWIAEGGSVYDSPYAPREAWDEE